MAYRFVDAGELNPAMQPNTTTTTTASYDHATQHVASTSSASSPVEHEKREEYEKTQDSDGSSDPSSDGIFMPVRPGDRAQLTHIATSMSLRHQQQPSYMTQGSYVTARTSIARSSSYASEHASRDPSHDLERRDTLAGIEPGDPVLDPTSDQFDAYKWARMLVRTMDG